MRRALFAVLIPAALSAFAAPAPKTFSVVHATLHDRQEDGPVLPEGYQYVSGELLYLSFRLSGFKVKDDKVDLRWQLVAVDPEGLLLSPPTNGAFREEVSYNDKDWLPKVQQTLALPGQIPPGDYKLKIRVADELAGATAEGEVAFKVGGKPFPHPDAFSVLDLQFFRSDADREPLSPSVFHPGETLFARFQLAGFQIGEKNLYNVGYSLSISDSTGKVLYTQPEAAKDSGSPFYPKRLLKGELNLNLTGGVLPAEYTLTVLAKDEVGNTKAEASARFQVAK